MNAAPQHGNHPVDKVLETKLAELVGTTAKALARKRERRIIPEGVWQKLDGRILYSISRYNSWVESQWKCQQEWSLSDENYESDSAGKEQPLLDGAKPSRSRKPQRESQRQPAYLIK